MERSKLIEDINSRLTDQSNKKLATAIYKTYNTKRQLEAALITLVAESYSKFTQDPDFNKVLGKAIREYNKVEMNSDQMAVEALSFYNHYHQIDTNLDMSVVSTEILDVYKKFEATGSKYSLEYYANNNGDIKITDRAVATIIALDAMVKGQNLGMSGAEYLAYKLYDHNLNADAVRYMNDVFKREDEIVEDTKLNFLLASIERFFADDFKVGEKVAKCPQLPPEEFKKTLKEGDVLIVYRKPKYIGFGGVIINKINSLTTGSSFMSIKLVGPQGKSVIGYGAFIGSTLCKEVPIDYFIETCAGIICIRHKDLRPMHASKITKYARHVKEMKVAYNPIDLIKSMFQHGKDIKYGPTKILSKDQAKTFYAPMICTTLITAAYRGAGLDPGVAVSDDIAWPIDVLKSDKFQSVSTYFAEDQGMDIKKTISFQSLNPEFNVEVDAALESFFSRDDRVRKLICSIKKVDAEELKKELREGDAVTCTRTSADTWKSWTNKHIMQGQSFTSLKMIGPDAKSVIGFGAKLGDDGGRRISEVSIDEFISTCRAIVICRPKEATPEQCHKAYEFMKSMQGRNLTYMGVGKNLVSCIKHIMQFGKRNDIKPLTKEELANYKGSLLCSSVVANAWRYADIDNGFHSTAEEDVWPRDFLLSDKIEYPAAYFVKGELPENYDSI